MFAVINVFTVTLNNVFFNVSLLNRSINTKD